MKVLMLTEFGQGIYPITSMHLMYQIGKLKKCMELVQAEWEIFDASPPKRRSKDKDRDRDRDSDNQEIKVVKEIKPVKDSTTNDRRTSGRGGRRRSSGLNTDGTEPPTNEFSLETPQQQQQPPQTQSWVASMSNAGQKFGELKQAMGSQLKHYFWPDRSAREGYNPTGFGQRAPRRFFSPH